ncbi:MAG: FAD-binding oxidoreductase [Pseudomonadota bacterium]
MLKTRLGSYLGKRLILPDQPDFDEVRTVWNQMIDRRPAAIAQCQTAEEVSRCVIEAKSEGLAVSVRGGGHNIAGTAVGEGALMIDMSLMRDVVVDLDNRLVTVQGGATWAEVDAATQAHGLAAAGGVVSSTGVAGLTLGGGFGWLARQHGLAVDNLLEVEMVLASGEIVSVSDETLPDLFWAIRGGSGNFGVATRFTFRLHPVGPEVLFGPTFFALNDAGTVLRNYADRAPRLSRRACVWANLMTAPPAPVLDESVHGTMVLTLMQFHLDPVAGIDDLTALYGGVEPLGSALMQRPFVEAQSFLDEAYDFGARNYWRAHNHRELTPDLIDYLVKEARNLPTPESELLICQLGGAISDIEDAQTAFPHRQILFVSTPGVRWRDPADDERVVGWLKQVSREISRHAVPGAYVNFIAESGGGASAAYGSNLARLQAVKKKYDPDNLFRVNQNVEPAEAG